VEGGFDGPYQPFHLLSPPRSRSPSPGPGDAYGLLARLRARVDLVRPWALTGVRLSVEVGRIQPHRDHVDESALAPLRQRGELRPELGSWRDRGDHRRAWPAWLASRRGSCPGWSPQVIEQARRVCAHSTQTELWSSLRILNRW